MGYLVRLFSLVTSMDTLVGILMGFMEGML